MRILLDECVPRKLDRELAPHFVTTVPKQGLSGKRDELLLRVSETDFDVFVTVDRNLIFEQNLRKLRTAVVVLHAASNRLAAVRLLVPELLQTLGHIQKGQVLHVPKSAIP
jgi:predicted nuclease of predicted toxin-antitoxin system